MAVVYSTDAINNRLDGVVDAIDGGATNGILLLRENSTVLATISLARPCGTVSGGVLTFTGQLLDDSADATGSANNAIITDGDGDTVISQLTVGIPLTSSDIIISNGLNSTLISSGQTVELLSAEIIGS